MHFSNSHRLKSVASKAVVIVYFDEYRTLRPPPLWRKLATSVSVAKPEGKGPEMEFTIGVQGRGTPKYQQNITKLIIVFLFSICFLWNPTTFQAPNGGFPWSDAGPASIIGLRNCRPGRVQMPSKRGFHWKPRDFTRFQSRSQSRFEPQPSRLRTGGAKYRPWLGPLCS